MWLFFLFGGVTGRGVVLCDGCAPLVGLDGAPIGLASTRHWSGDNNFLLTLCSHCEIFTRLRKVFGFWHLVQDLLAAVSGKRHTSLEGLIGHVERHCIDFLV